MRVTSNPLLLVQQGDLHLTVTRMGSAAVIFLSGKVLAWSCRVYYTHLWSAGGIGVELDFPLGKL